MVWSVQGIYRVHTARLSVPGRRCRFSCAPFGANEKHSTGRQDALRTGVQRTGLRSCGDILRCSDRAGNVRAKINRSSEVGFSEELDSTVAVRHGVLPETTTRLDPQNNGSLFA